MAKTYKILIYCFLTILTLVCFGCSSHKKINQLAKTLECSKTYHFVFNELSNFAKIEYKGEDTIGNSEYPDYKKTFKESIENLNESTEAVLIYKDAFGFPDDSVIQVSVKIKSIVWDFGHINATMSTELEYEVGNEKINLIGDNRIQIAGTKKGNLFKSLKSGTYQFLNVMCYK